MAQAGDSAVEQICVSAAPLSVLKGISKTNCLVHFWPQCSMTTNLGAGPWSFQRHVTNLQVTRLDGFDGVVVDFHTTSFRKTNQRVNNIS